MWALPALMALALLPTAKNTLSGVCLSFPAAGTASIIRVVKTVQSLTIATEWRINMSDILTIIAAVEWIVVGCLFLWRLRHWNRRFSELYDELRKEIGND